MDRQGKDKINSPSRRQKSIAELGLYDLETDDLSSTVHRAFQQICIILKIDCVLLLMLNSKKDKFVVSDFIGLPPGEWKKKEIKVSKKFDAGYTLLKKKPVVVRDYCKEKRFQKLPLLDDNIISGMHIFVKGSKVIHGVLGMYASKKQAFLEHDISLAQIIANLLGESIDRKRAGEKVNKINRQLKNEIERGKELQIQILKNSINERWKIGEYLHNELAHLLLAARLKIDEIEYKIQKKEAMDVCDEIGEAKKILKRAGAGVRDLSHEILPKEVETGIASEALHNLVSYVKQLYNVDCVLEADPAVDDIENKELASNLYHIAEEAAKNAVVHGKAKEIKLFLHPGKRQLHFSIEDDGKGFFSASNKEKKGMGIHLMQHRMELLGGTFEIESNPNTETGTKISCKLPLENFMQKKKIE